MLSLIAWIPGISFPWKLPLLDPSPGSHFLSMLILPTIPPLGEDVFWTVIVSKMDDT